MLSSKAHRSFTPAVTPLGPLAVVMQVDAPPPPCGLMPPRNNGYLPPFEILHNYGPVSWAFLTTHPLHLTLQRVDGGNTQALLAWHSAGLAVGITSAFLGDFLKEYQVQVKLLGVP